MSLTDIIILFMTTVVVGVCFYTLYDVRRERDEIWVQHVFHHLGLDPDHVVDPRNGQVARKTKHRKELAEYLFLHPNARVDISKGKKNHGS